MRRRGGGRKGAVCTVAQSSGVIFYKITLLHNHSHSSHTRTPIVGLCAALNIKQLIRSYLY